MFLLKNPGEVQLAQFLAESENDNFSYTELGSSRTNAPSGYNVDHNRVLLGAGYDTFEMAKAAVRDWKMFDMPWVKLFQSDTPIEVDQTVAILIHHYGFYSLNAARIVYVLDEIGEIERFGFAYGTLTEHGETGEERFSIEFHTDNDEVWYDLYAFSRPASVFVKIGYPLTRSLQKAFARDSKAAMVDAVSKYIASQRNK